MRIGINTLAVNRGDFGGGDSYLHYLLKHLARIDRANEYLLLVAPSNRDRFVIDQENFETVVCPVDIANAFKRVLYEQAFLPRLLARHRVDVLHCPNNVLPLHAGCRTVLTIQHMLNFLMPDHCGPFYRKWYLDTLMRLSATKADKIISVSVDNKSNIVEHLGVPHSKVTTVYHALDESFMRPLDSDCVNACLRKHRVSGDYILSVANNVLSKNLGGLLRAFDYVKQRYRIPHRLVVVGNRGFDRESQLWLSQMEKRYSDLLHTGYIDHSELPCIYRRASAFVLVSWCESFGIPLLEAMGCGTPIVTSNVSGMPEIVGSAGLKIDPGNHVQIGEAMYSVLSDDALRSELIRQGYGRVELFTWDKAAQQTLQVFEQAYRS